MDWDETWAATFDNLNFSHITPPSTSYSIPIYCLKYQQLPSYIHSTMPRGDAQQTIVHYKGSSDDFVVFAESAEAVATWRKDKSVPLAQVVNGFKIFVTHK